MHDLAHLEVLAHHRDRLGVGLCGGRLLPLLLQPALRRERGEHAQRDGEDQEHQGPAILHVSLRWFESTRASLTFVAHRG